MKSTAEMTDADKRIYGTMPNYNDGYEYILNIGLKSTLRPSLSV